MGRQQYWLSIGINPAGPPQTVYSYISLSLSPSFFSPLLSPCLPLSSSFPLVNPLYYTIINSTTESCSEQKFDQENERTVPTDSDSFDPVFGLYYDQTFPSKALSDESESSSNWDPDEEDVDPGAKNDEENEKNLDNFQNDKDYQILDKDNKNWEDGDENDEN